MKNKFFTGKFVLASKFVRCARMEDIMKNEAYEKRISELLKQMTLEEKVGQLRQCGPSIVGAFDVGFGELLDMMFDGKISKEEFERIMSTAEQDFREEDLRAGRIGS